MANDSSQASRSRKRLTRHIIIGMLTGALAGFLINQYGRWRGEDAVYEFLIAAGPEGLFEIVGQGFISLLQVLVVPLVFVSLVCGTAALDDVRRLGKIGLKTVGLYLMTTAVAITLALTAAILVRPGVGLDRTVEEGYEASEAPTLVEVITNIFPRNVIEAMASGNMLQIIVFSILLGIALSFAGEPGKRIMKLFEDANRVIMQLVWIVMVIAPYGVFALLAGTFAELGLDAILPLFKYFALVLGLLLLHAVVTYPLLLKLLSGLEPIHFLKKIQQVQIFAFSTASSNATIPVTLQAVEHRLGVKNSVASFTVPLGATINMDGTAIMQGVATVFIAQAYGLGLTVPDYLTVILIATMASIGTAGVPGVGLIMLSMVLIQVGLPVEGIALIIGIDRLLDMVRTAVNVTGDATVTSIVAHSEGALDRAVFDRDDNHSE